MDRFHVPIVADSLLSSIATFHTTKIIVIDPSKFPFNCSFPESMYACVSSESKVMNEYKQLPSFGPRELTPEMLKSLEDVDRSAKRGKRHESKKGGTSSKASTPKKHKSDKLDPSQPNKKKTKKAAKRAKQVSTSDSDYAPSEEQPNR